MKKRTKRMEGGASPDHHGLFGIDTEETAGDVIHGGAEDGGLAGGVSIFFWKYRERERRAQI